MENMFAAPVLVFLYSVKSALQAHVTQVWLLYYELDPNVNSSPQRTLYLLDNDEPSSYCLVLIVCSLTAWPD